MYHIFKKRLVITYIPQDEEDMDCPGPHILLGSFLEDPGFLQVFYYSQSKCFSIEVRKSSYSYPVTGITTLISNLQTNYLFKRCKVGTILAYTLANKLTLSKLELQN